MKAPMGHVLPSKHTYVVSASIYIHYLHIEVTLYWKEVMECHLPLCVCMFIGF